MSFKKSVVLLLTAAVFVSFADISQEISYISLDLLPEDAEERAFDLVEDWLAHLHPDENIVIGDPVPLQAPDGFVRALSYPLGLNHEGTLTLDDCLQVSIRYSEAKHARLDYLRSLDSEGKELFYNHLDEKAEELYSIVRSTGDEWDQYRFITLAFSDDNPVIIGTNNLVEFGAKEQETTSTSGDSGKLVRYAFCPWDGISIRIVGVYKTISGEEFYRFTRGCVLPNSFIESYVSKFPVMSQILENYPIFENEILSTHKSDSENKDSQERVYFLDEWEITQYGSDCWLATFCMRCLTQSEGFFGFSFKGDFPEPQVGVEGGEESYQIYYKDTFLPWIDSDLYPGDYYGKSFTEAIINRDFENEENTWLYNFEEDFKSTAGPDYSFTDEHNITYEFITEFWAEAWFRWDYTWEDIKLKLVDGMGLTTVLAQTLCYKPGSAGGNGHAVLLVEIDGADNVYFYDPRPQLTGVQNEFWNSMSDKYIAIECNYFSATGDSRIVISESSEDAQFLRWVPYLNFDVKGYTVLSRDEAGQITQLSGVIRANDDGGWQHFETESEGELGVRYYPIGNGEPVDVFAGEEFCFE